MIRICIVVIFLLASSMKVNADYSHHPQAKAFIQKMVQTYGLDEQSVKQSLKMATRRAPILEAIARPAEKTKPWHEYQKIFADADRIQQGRLFWEQNRQALDLYSNLYGVEPSIIVAIIGVETRYGRHMGNYKVIDALATLGFDYPPRADFFRGQLEQFLLLVKEQQLKPDELVGSYAGAMGYGQFMPSSYRAYAKDGNGDGRIDIWSNPMDAIASVANYFKEHGWQKGQPIFLNLKSTPQTMDPKWLYDGLKPTVSIAQWSQYGFNIEQAFASTSPAVLLGYEEISHVDYWLGLNNFYVITRYNRSYLYARAVWQLSREIEQAYLKNNASDVQDKPLK